MWAFGWQLTAPGGAQTLTIVGIGSRIFTSHEPTGRRDMRDLMDDGLDYRASVIDVTNVVSGEYTDKSTAAPYQRGASLAHTVDLGPDLASAFVAGHVDLIIEGWLQRAINQGATNTNLATHAQLFKAKAITTPAPSTRAASNVPDTLDFDQRGPGLTIDEDVLRPNGEKYLPRMLGDHHDIAVLRRLHQSRIPYRLYGPPGAGKTALAEAAHPGLITINGHGDMTVAHLVGTLLPAPGGGWLWQDGPLTRAMKEGRVLLVDEITRIPTEVLAVLYSTMDGRGVLNLDDRPDAEPVHAEDGHFVIAGYNPDTLGARELDEALISRFRIGIEVTTDYDAAIRLGVPQRAVTMARNLATRSEEEQAGGGRGIWAPQMRELLTFRDVIRAGLGEGFALSALVASCPRRDDVATLVEVASRVFGVTVDVPRLGVAV